MAAFHDGSQFGTDFQKLWQEARTRWLRPSEIYEILMNHFRFSISKEPLNLPPSGTLVLFDRKMLRNFRRDGHPWRKKKDNKTVKEAHEHLKVGSEEKIHVYYAHGDGDSNLQRRVYWLLDKALEHIVVVHYLEVKEVRTNMSLLEPTTTPIQSMQHESYIMYKPPLSSYFTGVEPDLSSGSSAGPASDPSLEVSELNSNENDDFDKFYLDELRSTGETGFGNASLESQLLSSRMSLTCEQVNYQGGGGNMDGCHTIWSNPSQMADNTPKYVDHNEGHVVDAFHPPMSNYHFENVVPEGAIVGLRGPYESQIYAPEGSCLSTTIDHSMKSENNSLGMGENSVSDGTCNSLQASWLDNGDEVLKKLDSLDRWMQRELPVENKTSPLAPSTTNSSSVLGAPMHDHKMIQDQPQSTANSLVTEEMTPSFKPQLFFEISDYSPTWGFSSKDTKVIVTGYFNGDAMEFEKLDWYCMFGDKEVRAEVVQLGVLRFKTPKDAALGTISFCIMDRTRQPCSDVMHFELKEDVQTQKQSTNAGLGKDYEDAMLQHKLAHLLLHNIDHTKMKAHKGVAFVPSECIQLIHALEQEWIHLDNLLEKRSIDLPEVKDLLLQLILKSMMIDLVVKRPASEIKSWRSFNSSGQTPLHLASALGYDWVLNILKASGTSIDFRDKQGWTALHWAACYGRERMVAALLAAGARPGTISDPTPENKSGCTPADVAASAGHEGLAGYLSEQDLASHLGTLTLAENDRDKQFASDEGHRVVEYLRRSMSLRRSVKTVEDELALEDSLSAIGNATISSARIHAAFREYFMRERLRAIEEEDEYGFSAEEQMAVQKIQRAYRNHREQRKKEGAALQIQNRFRVWKTRKNFLSLRQNVIKIQAYFRMHRARKHYHKILWSVGVLEKAVLRWRQRRKGLRGYQPEVPSVLESKDGNDFLQIGRKQAEDALDRAVLLVQSMVRSKLARQQYKRMKETFELAKANLSNSDAIDQVMREGDVG